MWQKCDLILEWKCDLHQQHQLGVIPPQAGSRGQDVHTHPPQKSRGCIQKAQNKEHGKRESKNDKMKK